MVFCNSLFANPIGVAAPMLLYDAVASIHGLFQLAACKSYWSGYINVALRCCCAHRSMVFRNSLLANPLGVAASMLPYVVLLLRT